MSSRTRLLPAARHPPAGASSTHRGSCNTAGTCPRSSGVTHGARVGMVSAPCTGGFGATGWGGAWYAGGRPPRTPGSWAPPRRSPRRSQRRSRRDSSVARCSRRSRPRAPRLFLHVDDQLARCASRGSRARGRACDHARAGRLRRRSGGKARCVMQTLAAQQRPFGPAGRGVILEDILRWPGAASRARSLVNSGSGRQMRPEWTRSTADVGNAVTGKVSPLRPASLYPRRQVARLMLTERVGPGTGSRYA